MPVSNTAPEFLFLTANFNVVHSHGLAIPITAFCPLHWLSLLPAAIAKSGIECNDAAATIIKESIKYFYRDF
jgi:hypothetical protein